jgi:hypothetical protein
MTSEQKIEEIVNEMYLLKINNVPIIKIQSLFRGYLTRKKLQREKDGMTMGILLKMLKKYNSKIIFNKKINVQLTRKKIRNENFPCEISENIVKFYIFKYRKIMGNWDTKCGDLEVLNKKIEIKGFMSTGPSSFGPSEKWDLLYFVDCRKTLDGIFKIYEIKLSNDNAIWQNIKISKKQTFGEMCLQGKRHRLVFKSIQKQLQRHCKCVFSDHINKLI